MTSSSPKLHYQPCPQTFLYSLSLSAAFIQNVIKARIWRLDLSLVLPSPLHLITQELCQYCKSVLSSLSALLLPLVQTLIIAPNWSFCLFAFSFKSILHTAARLIHLKEIDIIPLNIKYKVFSSHLFNHIFHFSLWIMEMTIVVHSEMANAPVTSSCGSISLGHYHLNCNLINF